MKLSLSQRLVRYLQRNHGWISGGDIQRVVAEHTTYTPQNVGRRLRELVTSGDLEVQYRSKNGVRHAYYRAIINESPEQLARQQVAFFDSYQPK